ncbi:MAG: class I SAM-dependent methyltransferase [Spartobacteria bacterium]|nr:class I SAM-dependent methyltransferase [Spartobacteria bacterium]
MSEQDTRAVHDFFQGWMLYWRVVDENYISHREIYSALNAFLKAHYKEPFILLDCGCGDSSYMVKGIAGTAIHEYIGIDLSENALDLSQQNIEGLGFDVTLVQGDFSKQISALETRPDVVWIGLSLHHLPLEQKKKFMKDCRGILDGTGHHLLIFEPYLKEGETREEYLARWWAECHDHWVAISDEEREATKQHVFSADFPESFSTFRAIAKEAGFADADVVLADPKELYAFMAFAT